jgi:CheY-like chemotaxis protein
MQGRAIVADDDATIRRLVRGWLEGLGLTVEEAVDGEELLQLATQTDREAPVLLVVDQQMPRRTGLEALAAIRAAGCNSPAILASGTSLPDQAPPRRTAILPKPFREEEFLNRATALVVDGASLARADRSSFRRSWSKLTKAGAWPERICQRPTSHRLARFAAQ